MRKKLRPKERLIAYAFATARSYCRTSQDLRRLDSAVKTVVFELRQGDPNFPEARFKKACYHPFPEDMTFPTKKLTEDGWIDLKVDMAGTESAS